MIAVPVLTTTPTPALYPQTATAALSTGVVGHDSSDQSPSRAQARHWNALSEPVGPPPNQKELQMQAPKRVIQQLTKDFSDAGEDVTGAEIAQWEPSRLLKVSATSFIFTISLVRFLALTTDRTRIYMSVLGLNPLHPSTRPRNSMVKACPSSVVCHPISPIAPAHSTARAARNTLFNNAICCFHPRTSDVKRGLAGTDALVRHPRIGTSAPFWGTSRSLTLL